MKKILVILTARVFTNPYLQAQSIKIVDALFIMGKDTSGLRAWAKARRYQPKRSQVSDFLHFEYATSVGTQEMDIAVKNRKINAISWAEHLMYISVLKGDADMLNGFTMKPQVNSKVLSFENLQKGLLLNLIIQEEVNQLRLVIGKKQ
jgi:hypothetical protein